MSISGCTYLFTGSNYTRLIEEAQFFIKKALCLHNACHKCVTCQHIEQKQHYLLCWLTAHNQYTLAQLEVVHKTLAFDLAQQEHYFFVFERAELLSSAAHSLLKSFEEPARGYHFILITTRPDSLLDTVRSRCIIHRISSSEHADKSLLTRFFMQEPLKNLSELSRELDKSKINEQETVEFLDYIYSYWADIYKKNLVEEQQDMLIYAQKVLALLDQARTRLPMPGSTKIFLRNLFLQFVLIKKAQQDT